MGVPWLGSLSQVGLPQNRRLDPPVDICSYIHQKIFRYLSVRILVIDTIQLLFDMACKDSFSSGDFSSFVSYADFLSLLSSRR